MSIPLDQSSWQITWRYFKTSRGGMVGLAFLVILLLVVIFADIIAPSILLYKTAKPYSYLPLGLRQVTYPIYSEPMQSGAIYSQG